MSFSDMIKKSALEAFSSGALSTAGIVTSLAMAVLMGLFIHFVYRTTAKGGFYNRSLNKSLAVLPVITAGIMLGMQSNLVISLGMVGALSIVRFRNAVKDPIDLTYLFWSISVGILTGVGLFMLAILLSMTATVLLVFLDLMPAVRSSYLLVVSGELDAERDMMWCVKKHCRRAKVRSRNVSKKGLEWIIEIQLKDESALLKDLSQIDGIFSMNLLCHDGDVRF